MTQTGLQALITEYLHEAKLMQIATSQDGQPWLCSVWFAPDDELNLYWLSSMGRRHSQELEANSKAAAAVALPHVPSDKPRGLQITGTAGVVTGQDDVARALDVYAGRIFPQERITAMMHAPGNEHCFFRLTPSEVVLFDAVNFADNPRQVLTLATEA